MGALLPTLQPNRLREGLTDYLATTFALTDPDTQAALSDFVGDARDGMFKGPYVRLRLPFAPARGNWGMRLDWLPDEFVPYGHQAKAFERLSTKFQARPQPTLVTTGTGSGKTESFLIPILDHVVRAKRQGVAGMKALIIYPMNALANDQEQRLARLISASGAVGCHRRPVHRRTEFRWAHPGFGGWVDHRSPAGARFAAGYPAHQLQDARSSAAAARPCRDVAAVGGIAAVRGARRVPHYDGAQGTDVAMLLRRLGSAVKSYWTESSPVTGEDRARPLGRITPVATSATLGGGGEPTAMLEFAHTVFGEVFGKESLVGEARLELPDWLADRDPVLDRRYVPIAPAAEQAVNDLDVFSSHSPNNAFLTAAVLATLFERTGDEHPTFAELAAELRRLDATEQLDLAEEPSLVHPAGRPIHRRHFLGRAGGEDLVRLVRRTR